MILGRIHHQSGIALGSILFIIAVLAIIAAAISAGSGGFTTSTTNESAKQMAAVIIQESEQVQSAVQELMANGCLETQLNFYAQGYIGANPSAPSNGSCNIFDPRGGAMQFQPLQANACNGGTCVWAATDGNIIPGVGTGVPQPLWQVYYITQAVCNQINAQLGVTISPNNNTPTNGNSYDGTFPSLATLSAVYTGVTAACVYQGTNGYLFYRVLWTR